MINLRQDPVLPFVSVIVPVYNDEKRIGQCIEALLKQTYPKDRYEIIVVDNGSTDETRRVIGQYPVTMLIEDSVRSSYAARNCGLAMARGYILAFTDSDCLPVHVWIESGVFGMKKFSADMVSGNVRFAFSARKTGAEIWDSLTNMQIERNIRERKITKTANLFNMQIERNIRERKITKTANLLVQKKVFQLIGPFPSELKSGGDVIWTGKASRRGFKLTYVCEMEVIHPARALGKLVKKQYRVGKGQQAIWQCAGEPVLSCLKRMVKNLFFPPSLSWIRKLLAERGTHVSAFRICRVWLASWTCQAATACGNLASVGLCFEGKTKEV